MSGEGLLSALPADPGHDGAGDERADVLAYLARRRDNALAVARTSAEGDELHGLALDRARQLEVVIDEIRGGLHEGVARIEAARRGDFGARKGAEAQRGGAAPQASCADPAMGLAAPLRDDGAAPEADHLRASAPLRAQDSSSGEA